MIRTGPEFELLLGGAIASFVVSGVIGICTVWQSESIGDWFIIGCVDLILWQIARARRRKRESHRRQGKIH